MVLTQYLDASFSADETILFFTIEMELNAAIVVRIGLDGVKNVQQLKDKKKEDWEHMYKNIQRETAIVAHFGQHSLAKLIVASDAVRYYIAISRLITPDMMKWTTLENFKEGMAALHELKLLTPQPLPKLTKSFGPLQWATPALLAACNMFGLWKHPPVPLGYLCREHEAPTNPPPALEADEGYTEGGSYQEELIARAPMKGKIFNMDNSLFWQQLELSTRGGPYHTTVMQFPKKGRQAYQNIVSQHLGDGIWTAEIKLQETILRAHKWTGTGNMPLDRFIRNHRDAYLGLVRASQHVQFQLPEEFTRVTYLLDGMDDVVDPALHAAMGSVRLDTTGLRCQFEATAVLLINVDPVAKRLASGKRPIGKISDATGVAANIGSMRSGTGKTGVSLRYYAPPEYAKLNAAQKSELHDWRNTDEGQASKAAGKQTNKSPAKKQKTKQRDLDRKQKYDKDVASGVRAELSAMMGEANLPPVAPPVLPPPAPSTAPVVAPQLRAQLQAAMALMNQHIGSVAAIQSTAAVPAVPPTVAAPFPALPALMRHIKNPPGSDGKQSKRE